MDICNQDTLDIKYEKLRLVPSKSAAYELIKHGLALYDCKEILENGYEPRKRSKDTIERWKDFGDKTFNVVIVKSYNFIYQEDVWLITHVGKFTKQK